MAKVPQDWLSRFRASQAAACRPHDPCGNVVFDRGEGSSLWSVDGEEWMDLTCGYSASNFGHAYSPLVKVAQDQLSKLSHLTGDAHPGRIELAEKLIAQATKSNQAIKKSLRSISDSPRKVIFNATGARAIESAWKAMYERKPGKLLVLGPDFHGRSVATSCLSMTSHSALSEQLRDLVHKPGLEDYPYCCQCPIASQYPGCQVGCATSLFDWITTNANEISGVLVEPVATARGYIFPPASFFLRLREITREHDLPVAVDEIQSGLGRTANFSLAISQGWEPDFIVFGKSLGGGIIPISATLGPGEWLDALPAGSESETFAATPLACAVALKVLDLLEYETIVQNGWTATERIRAELFRHREDRFQVEGQGGACVLEFAGSLAPSKIEAGQTRARRFAEACAAQRLKVQLSGPRQTRVVMLPALTIRENELAVTLERIRAALAEE